MIRQMLKLVVEAAKVEIIKVLDALEPGMPPESVPAAPAPVPVKPDAFYPEGYLDTLRAKDRCPFCAGPKPVGPLMCGPCDKIREPLRAKARKAAEARGT